MGTELLAVIFGLASGISWGAGDFGGGLASKRLNTFMVIILSQVVGIGLLLALAFGFVVESKGRIGIGTAEELLDRLRSEEA